MPGSWEIQNPEVLVAILTREMVTTKWAINFKRLYLPESSDIITLSGMPFDHARNSACLTALIRNYKRLMFIDDDVLLPHDAYTKLSSHNKKVISGIYYRRVPPLNPVMLVDTSTGPKYIEKFPKDTLINADLVGAGCLLIETDLLMKMKKDWFDWKVDREDLQPDDRTSEDYSFCRRVRREMNIEIFVDTSIVCEHIGHSISKDGVLSPAL